MYYSMRPFSMVYRIRKYYSNTNTHTHARTHARTHAHTHTHTHTRTHARTHARTHTHTHAHTQIVLLEMAIYLGASLERFSYYVHHWNDSAIRCIIGTIQLLGASLERFSY